MARFEEFLQGMAKVHGSGSSLFSSVDFPPLSSKAPSSSMASSTATTQAAAPGDLHGSGSRVPPVSDVVPLMHGSQSSCSSLFHSGEGAKLQFHQPGVVDGKPSIFILKFVRDQVLQFGPVVWLDNFWVILLLSHKFKG